MKTRNVLLAILAATSIVAVYRFVASKSPGALRTVPVELHGSWVTDDARYSDRYLQVGPDFVAFGTGGVDVQRFRVEGCDRESGAVGERRYTVFFSGADREVMSRGLVLSDTGRLTFASQPEVEWVRD
ncbi:MAG: hypothetical protein MUC56_10930 [Thermoanaerobaculales bacterium]|jgi:hypothetical protein|nr:hypothetical protein [Thermoanaerobaculales bacterium]